MPTILTQVSKHAHKHKAMEKQKKRYDWRIIASKLTKINIENTPVTDSNLNLDDIRSFT